MKLGTNLVVALFLIATGVSDVTAAVLRQAITVDADVVRLGDLFVDSGDKRHSIVASAPSPGAKFIFGAARLKSIARRAGLSWHPRNRHEKVVVTRAGRLVSADEITKLVQAGLKNKGLQAGYEIALSKNNLTFHIAAEDNRNIRISQTRYNQRGRQFSAIIEVPSDRSSYNRVQVTGSVFKVLEVPVLARSIQRGETIRMSDLEFIKQRRSAIGRNTVVDTSRIVGKTPRRYLQTGKPIRMSDLRMPILVSRGKLVTLTLKNRHMHITAQGSALEDGAIGDVIRVTNTRSRQTVQGVVIGPSQVAMQLANQSK